MKLNNENRNWLAVILLLFLWSAVVAISLLINYNLNQIQPGFEKLIIIHISLWLLGSVILAPASFIIQKNFNRKRTSESGDENLVTVLNALDIPVFIYDKNAGSFNFINKYAKEKFEIIKKDEYHFEVPKLACLISDLQKYSNSLISNIKLEHTCSNTEEEEVHFESILNDIKIRGIVFTLVVINDKSDSEKDLMEMNDYIEDLHAKEDALEDNAFDLIQLTIQLEESEKNLREANANKDKFFSIVAHDLKSPFVGLLGITEMLDSDYDEFEEKERRELIRSLYDISKSTFELLEGLLDWARAKQGKMSYNPRMFNLYKVADSLVNLLRANTFKKEITVINNVKIDSEVYGDRDMVSTVLRNLFANAIKFTPLNGTIEFNSVIENDLMKVTVKDSGIGISEEDIDKLFRIDVNHTTLGTNEEKGTGLGLILCKELIERHGTEIWVESEVGKGSTFVFTLPLKSEVEEVENKEILVG